MSDYRTVTIHELADAIAEFGPIEFSDILDNELVGHSVEFANDSPDTIAFIHATIPDSDRKIVTRVMSDEEFYALIPHAMDNVVIRDSVVNALESVYAAMLAANAVDYHSDDLRWAFQDSIYGALEMTLIKMLIDLSDGDTEWTSKVINAIVSAGEVRYILAQFTATNAYASV